MYIKLTRLDGQPIWINAAFVVTIEPRKGGGAVVVPIGDGLDYDVRETPERVLAVIGDAPSPTVVPVPPPKGLAPKAPDDVSGEGVAEPETRNPEPETRNPEPETASPEPETRNSELETPNPEPAEEKPAKKPARKTTRKTTRKAKKPELPLTPEQVDRLIKMAPGSLRKLQNTLTAQFKIETPDAVVEALVAHGVLTLDRDHVEWAK